MLAVCFVASTLAPARAQSPDDRWAGAMAAFAEQDAALPYPRGSVVFVGSSSIRLWDLAKSFPKSNPAPLNRGFGGSRVSDSVRYVELLVLQHKPRLVVMYAGDNDIAAGLSPDEVSRDFEEFAGIVLEELPDAQLAYIAIKPSLSRWKLAPKIRQANALIRADCEENQRLTFIDVWSPMLGDDGRPRKELFREDGLHLNDAGYRLWTGLVAPVLAVRESQRVRAAQ